MSKVRKIVSAFCITALLMAYVSPLAGEVQAAYEELEKQKTDTNLRAVKFDSFFSQEDEKKHSVQGKIGESLSLSGVIELNETGILKDARISLENTNYQLQKAEGQEEVISHVDQQNQKIYLNTLSQDQAIKMELGFHKQSDFYVDHFAKESKVVLEGTFLNEKGNEKQVKKEISIQIDWKQDIETKLEQSIDKVVSYQENQNEKTMIEQMVKVGIDQNKLPVQKIQLAVQTPLIDGMKPEEVIVYANSTAGTNGKENGDIFSNTNWTYNNQTGEVFVQVENEMTQEGKVAWKDGMDEYKVVMIYQVKLEDQISLLELKTNAMIQAYGKTEAIAKEERKEVALPEKSKGFTQLGMRISNSLNKGYLYAGNNYETPYQTNGAIEIKDSKKTEGIEVSSLADQFITKEGRKEEASTVYKQTSIRKKNFDQILGTTGSITVYNQEGIQIGIVDSQTQVDEQGNIVLNYDSGTVKQIRMVMSKAVAEGKLEWKHTKAILDTGKTRETIKEYQQLQTTMYSITNQVGMEQDRQEIIGEITLKETQTQLEASINRDKLTTTAKNENVEIKGILKTNSNDQDLYQNPTIYVVLPKQVEQVDLKSINLLYTEELKVQDAKVEKNENGNLVIQMITTGNQTQYSTEYTNPTLLLNVDLTLSKIATSGQEQIIIEYTNDKATSLKEEGRVSLPISVEAPNGIIAVNTIKQDQENSEVSSINGEKQVATIQKDTKAKIATVGIDILNNKETKVSNMIILGRVPSKDITNPSNQEKLENTFDASLQNEITTNYLSEDQYEVYYSENGNATQELENSDNGWKMQIEDKSKIKSYLIQMKDKTLESKQGTHFEYQIAIPDGLSYNQAAYETYTVYYTDEMQRTTQSQKEAGIVGVATQLGPVLKAQMTTNTSGMIDTNNTLEYTITVKNEGQEAATGVKIEAMVPDKTVYLEYKPGSSYAPSDYEENPDIKKAEFNVATIQPNETITKTFRVRVKAVGVITNSAKITAQNIESQLQSDTVEVIANLQKVSIGFGSNANVNMFANQEVLYTCSINNVMSSDIHNVVLTMKLPEGIEYKEARLVIEGETTEKADASYNQKDRVVTVKLGTIKPNDLDGGKINQKRLQIIVMTSDLAGEEDSKAITTGYKIVGDEIGEMTSATQTFQLVTAKLTSSVTSDHADGYIKEGETLNYEINLKNESKRTLSEMTIKAMLPEQVEYVKAFLIEDGKEKEVNSYQDGVFELMTSLLEGKEAKLKIQVLVKPLSQIDTDKIETKIEISSPNIETRHYSVKHRIQENENIKGEYKIQGVAWLDSNQNGRKDENEETLAGIPIRIWNSSTNQFAKTKEGENIVAVTDAEGNYTLNGMTKGNYMVIFDYDTSKYKLAQYQKEGVEDTLNSDAIAGTIKEEGKETKVGLTNTISLEKNSVYGINIGLIEAENLDFKVEKTVSKVTVQNKKGTKTYFYGSKLAKVELDPKLLDNTNVTVEYTMKVSNVGKVGANLKELVDKKPAELNFKSELNPDWYEKDNQLINTKLGQVMLQPGETKECKLILTKKMTNNTTGVISNTAFLGELYNSLGITDRNPKDNTSSAELILGVKTGGAVILIGAIGIAGVTTIVLYIIRKKQGKEEK